MAIEKLNITYRTQK